MLSTDFQFHRPADLADALALLEKHTEDGKVLAGGMTLVPSINIGVARPESLISLNHVAGLDAIEEDADAIRIGATVRHARICSDLVIARHLPLLARAASFIGDVQVRNRGTIGGSLAHADPAADYVPVAVALDATLRLAGPAGERIVPARSFFLDVLQTDLRADEILVEVRIPKLPPAAGYGYARFSRVEGSLALVNAAAVVTGTHCTVAIGGAVAPPALLELPVGGNGTSLPDAAGDAAFEACADALGDLSATPEYRRALARVFARRAVAEALRERSDLQSRESETDR